MRIIHNRIRCLNCNDIIESTTNDGYVWCSCKACAVSGGHRELVRSWTAATTDINDIYEELSETEEDQEVNYVF